MAFILSLKAFQWLCNPVCHLKKKPTLGLSIGHLLDFLIPEWITSKTVDVVQNMDMKFVVFLHGCREFILKKKK